VRINVLSIQDEDKRGTNDARHAHDTAADYQRRV
jgi:hypothetical protein